MKPALLLLLLCSQAFAAAGIISPKGSQSAFFEDNGGRVFPAQVVFTTDGSGNVLPVLFDGSMTIGTVNQGTSPWVVADPSWIADFDAWKTWADVQLSSRASEATLALLNGKVVTVDTSNVTVTSSVLPSGAATSANQNTANSSLSSIDSKLTSPIAVSQNGTWTVQQGTPPWSVSQSGSWTTGRTWTLLNSTDSVNSVQSGTWNINNIVGTISLPTGAATDASVVQVDTDLLAFKAANHTDLTTSQPRKLQDGSGNAITSQTNGAQRALDVGINVSGVQVDPRSIRALTASDVVTSNQGGTWTTGRTWSLLNSTDSVNSVQSGTWTTGRTWTLASGTDSVAAVQSGAWSVTANAGTNLNTSALQLDTTGAKLNLAQASTTASQTGPLIQGAVTTAAPTYTTAQTSPLSLTTTGALRTDNSANNQPVVGNVASAATDSGNPVKVGGIVNLDGSLFTNGQRANEQMNEAGSIYTDRSGRIASYSAFSSFTTAATATDIFTITGSATKTIKIRTVNIFGTNTGNTNALVLMLKRSTANSGGTSTTLTNVPNDSNNAAGTATVRSYTVNPTTGTLVGNIQGELIFLPTLASTNSLRGEEITFGTNGEQPIVLRGTSEVFSVNLNSVALLGTTVMNISLAWTEE